MTRTGKPYPSCASCSDASTTTTEWRAAILRESLVLARRVRDATLGLPGGLRWADIDFSHSAIGFSRAYVDGTVGPVLRATKTHRTYRVAIDDASVQRLVDHYRRALNRGGGAVSGQAFVFTADADGGAPWLPNRVTKNFIGHRRRAGVGEFRLHDYADTSPQLRCSPMVLPWSPSRNDLATPERRPP